ncbi:hypothetical protein chiPu_0007596 [Chiloscyllium punctatum]|uniref:Fibronectin type-III domain-containing protein n=1 Tax=Chiloscyllium punctatum TaxID=137246 RepID=A0A401SFH7_CHIPU|nr:hypothetical protein [Chiloscyllium punctatum]
MLPNASEKIQLKNVYLSAYPKPGDIVVISVTNVSISLAWGRPADLNGTQYNFSITYSSSDTSGNKTAVSNFTTITDLLPGTNYTIAVATIIVNGSGNDPVVKNVFTIPNAVTNIILVNRNTTSITLRWDRQSDYKAEYRYKVETIGDPSSNSTVSNESTTVVDLNPGTKYTFRLLTLAGDETASDPVTISFTTGKETAQYGFWIDVLL